MYKRIEAMQYDQIFNNNKKSQRWKSLCAHRSTNVHNEPEGPVTFSLYQTLRPGSEAGRVELRVNTTPVMRGVLSLATLHCYFRSIRIFSGVWSKYLIPPLPWEPNTVMYYCCFSRSTMIIEVLLLVVLLGALLYRWCQALNCRTLSFYWALSDIK